MKGSDKKKEREKRAENMPKRTAALAERLQLRESETRADSKKTSRCKLGAGGWGAVGDREAAAETEGAVAGKSRRCRPTAAGGDSEDLPAGAGRTPEAGEPEKNPAVAQYLQRSSRTLPGISTRLVSMMRTHSRSSASRLRAAGDRGYRKEAPASQRAGCGGGSGWSSD